MQLLPPPESSEGFLLSVLLDLDCFMARRGGGGCVTARFPTLAVLHTLAMLLRLAPSWCHLVRDP